MLRQSALLKSNQCFIYCSVINACDSICAFRTEYRCGKRKACNGYPALCNGHYDNIWHDCCRAYTVYRGKCSWYFYIGYDRSYHGKCLYPFLYLGLHLCGNPFQLQRLFCGMWKVLYRISAQYNFDYICACSGFVSGIEIFYRYAVSNGTCGTGGVTGIRGNLCDCIYIVKEKKPRGIDSMNQDGKSFNR